MLSPKIVRAAVERHADVAGPLKGSEGLSAESYRELRAWALETIRQLPRQASGDEETGAAWTPAMNAAYRARDVLYDLGGLQQGRPLSRSEVTTLLGYMAEDQGEETWRCYALASVLVVKGTDVLEPNELFAVAEHVSWPADLCRLAQAAHATPELWRHLLGRSSSPAVRDTIGRLPAAVADPEVRAILSGSSQTSVLTGLLRDAEPAEFVKLFRRLAAKDPVEAVSVLEARPEAKAWLRRGDLAKLLKAKDQETRMLAITLVSELSAAPDRPRRLATR